MLNTEVWLFLFFRSLFPCSSQSLPNYRLSCPWDVSYLFSLATVMVMPQLSNTVEAMKKEHDAMEADLTARIKELVAEVKSELQPVRVPAPASVFYRAVDPY